MLFFFKKNLTPEPWPDGELVFEQSSELDEDVDVGVMETELFPEMHIKKKKKKYINFSIKKRPLNRVSKYC